MHCICSGLSVLVKAFENTAISLWPRVPIDVLSMTGTLSFPYIEQWILSASTSIYNLLLISEWEMPPRTLKITFVYITFTICPWTTKIKAWLQKLSPLCLLFTRNLTCYCSFFNPGPPSGSCFQLCPFVTVSEFSSLTHCLTVGRWML